MLLGREIVLDKLLASFSKASFICKGMVAKNISINLLFQGQIEVHVHIAYLKNYGIIFDGSRGVLYFIIL
jgi:hypothetical protein